MNPIHLPSDAAQAIFMLRSCGFEAYAVGGFVRDSLLGRCPNDIDLATNALPEETERVFSTASVHSPMKKFGTVLISFNSGSPLEITTYRSEADYRDHRHPTRISFVSSLKEDLGRRDFTVNALAYQEQTGVVDFYGGLDDLKRKVLRPVGEGKRRFQEDALRILRAFRFQAQLGFEIPGDVQNDISVCRELLKAISAERIQEELRRLLAAPHSPAAIALLTRLQVLDWIIPVQSEERLTSLEKIRDAGLPVQLAFLFSCLPRSEALYRISLLKLSRATSEQIQLLLTYTDEPFPIPIPRLKRLLREFSPDRFWGFCQFSTALRPEQAAAVAQTEEAACHILASGECYDMAGLAVDGSELLALGLRGADIGKALEYLLDGVINGFLPNDKDVLIQAIQKQAYTKRPAE